MREFVNEKKITFLCYLKDTSMFYEKVKKKSKKKM